MSELKVIYRSIGDLSLRDQNPRTHSDAQIKQLMQSIEHFVFTNPVLIVSKVGVVAGHGRIEAAKRLGQLDVPTILLSDMSENDIRAYVIADNKLAENAGWDRCMGLSMNSSLSLSLATANTSTNLKLANTVATVPINGLTPAQMPLGRDKMT